MNILSIHTYQGMQNAIPPAENKAALSGKAVSSSASITSISYPGESGNTSWSSPSVMAQIDSLQQHVEGDLNIVRDPPFFPIATYQRADLIKRVRVIEEAVQQLGLDKGMKATLSATHLKDQATDKEIASALDKLFAFRDRTGNRGASSPKEIEPGSILAVEV